MQAKCALRKLHCSIQPGICLSLRALSMGGFSLAGMAERRLAGLRG
jgi:hypothetical protein